MKTIERNGAEKSPWTMEQWTEIGLWLQAADKRYLEACQYHSALTRQQKLIEAKKRWKKWNWVIIAAAVLIGMLGLRHLNTVSQRAWSTKWSNDTWTETVPAHWNYVDIDHSTGKLKSVTEWVPEEQVRHPASNHQKLLYTAESLFGSSYRVRVDETDQGVNYKNFRVAFLQTFGDNEHNLKILRTIDP